MNLNTNLPTIQNNEDLIQAVSARELYNFLEPTERFINWFNRQLQYGFELNKDYLGCEVFNTLAKQTLQDFFITVDMAKEISMIQRSDKGKQARQYFIECEQVAKQQTIKLPTLSEALQLAADQAKKIEADAKKVHHYDTVVERFNLMTATQVGQKLGMTANKLNKHLEELGAYNKSVKRGRAFKQWFIDEGYGVMKEANKGYSQALITSKGQAYIVEQLTHLKAVPEANIERITVRQNHTNSVIAQVDSLLAS